MPSQRSHLLSIALTPTGADIVEAKRAGQGVQIVRRSTLAFAPDAGLDTPTVLGSSLGKHLSEQGYSTKHAVIGLCPRWVLARHKHVPPADTEALRGIVNLQIEREFAAGAADMHFDYVLGEAPDPSGQMALLLVGVRQALLRQIEQVALAAGLRLEGITPTTLSIASPNQSGLAVLVEPGITGVMRLHNGSVHGLVSCSADVPGLAEQAGQERLLTDLSRCSLQLPSTEADQQLSLVLPASVAEQDANALASFAKERFGDVKVRRVDSAESLAEHVLSSDKGVIDFNASRLAAPTRRRLSPTAQWLIRAAVLVLLIGGTGAYLWLDATSRRDALQDELDLISDKAAELDEIRIDARLAERWFGKRPPVLDAMLELTKTFPTDGQIRVETLVMQGDLDCQIECTAEDRQTMDRYFSQMQQSAKLTAVNRGSVRPSGGKSSWIDFPVSCQFDPKGQGVGHE